MAGLSLLELMTVITIVAILMSIAATTYRSITVGYRISGEINGLLGDVQYARSEAIKQGQNVVICVSTTGVDCAAGNTNWNQGWIVFVDPTGGKTTNNNGALVLRQQAAFTSTDTLTDGATSNLSFDREGLAVGTATVLLLHNSTNDATKTRCLEVTNIGGVSVQQPSTLTTCT
jgi:type IV fimbrial biogenesis protein FimT